MLTASHLRQLLADIDAKRENARALIRDLQAELTRLAAERKPIADALRSVIYPIVDLAPELTLEIFAYYAAGGYDPVTCLVEANSGMNEYFNMHKKRTLS
uniref:Uncharacterized protein n=1 Tax=Mycena chlorophos TaxID=658473 RepID=A0ABQ0LKW4_MYCCL|nr:predicted protein [Mycena chlorophos]